MTVMWRSGTTMLGIGVVLVSTFGCRSTPPRSERDTASQMRERPLPACVSTEGEEPTRFARDGQGVPSVSPDWLAENRCHVAIVDVREREELSDELGHVQGAQWIPFDDIETVASRFPPDQPVILVARSTRRSSAGVAQLVGLGMHRVAYLSGGMLAWHEFGFPVDRSVPPDPPPAEPVAPVSDPHTSWRAEDAVAGALADSGAIVWTTAASLVSSSSLSCIDGRADHPVLGAPGGDAGEMILALASLERASGHRIDLEHIPAFFDAWIESFGRFYLHTDEHALERLREAVLSDPRFAYFTTNLVTLEETVGLIRRPPVDLQHAMLEHLLAPQHIGCGHLRLLLSHPHEYGVRPELARAVLETAFRHGWRRPDQLSYTVLEGAHHERAIVRVLFDHEVEAHTRVAMLVPHGALGEVFVVHPQVIDFVRRETAGFLVTHASELGLPISDRRRVVGAMRELGARQIGQTAAVLAPTLPVLEVRFANGGMTVRPAVEGPTGAVSRRAKHRT